MKNRLQFNLVFAVAIFISGACPDVSASRFLPDGLKEGTVREYSDTDVGKKIDRLPSNIEALDLMENSSGFQYHPELWLKLKRFKNLKRLEIGGSEYHVAKEFAELYDLPLESIYIRADTIDREVSQQMYKLKHLKRLALIVHNEYKEDVLHLEDVAKIESLEELKASCTSYNDIALLAASPNLKRIELGAAGDVFAIKQSQLKKIEQVCLNNIGSTIDSDTALTKKGLEALATMPMLKNLDLSGQQLSDDTLKPISTIATLERLNLGNTPITDIDLGYLKSLINLRALHLTNTNATDAGLKQLSSLKNLEELDILGSKTSGLGIKYLKGLPLKRLRMSAISNANLVYIADLPDLRYLDLEAATLTEIGARHLASCPSLIAIRIGAVPPEKEKKIAILKELAKIKTLKQVTGVYSDKEFQKAKKAILPKGRHRKLSPDEQSLLDPLILNDNSHDITNHFGCFR